MAVKHIITLGIGAAPTSLLWFITSGLGIFGALATSENRIFIPEAETRILALEAETRIFTPEAE